MKIQKGQMADPGPHSFSAADLGWRNWSLSGYISLIRLPLKRLVQISCIYIFIYVSLFPLSFFKINKLLSYQTPCLHVSLNTFQLLARKLSRKPVEHQSNSLLLNNWWCQIAAVLCQQRDRSLKIFYSLCLKKPKALFLTKTNFRSWLSVPLKHLLITILGVKTLVLPGKSFSFK